MTELVLWVIAHPLVSILGAIAVPVSATAFNALRRSRVAEEVVEPEVDSAAPAVEPEAASLAASPPVVEPEVAPLSPAAPTVEPEPVARPVVSRVPLRERLGRTRDGFVGRLEGLLRGRTVDSELLDELEALLFTADLGVSTAESLLETVRSKASGSDAASVRAVLRDAILEKLEPVQAGPLPSVASGPLVILVLGVNGSGKTTTIGKLASRFVADGKSVILGAGDTFRAAAIEQLQIWGERSHCDVIAGKPGSDPTAVAFDTVNAAKARGIDIAIIDTAGRLQTKKPLMQELEKMCRVLARECPDAPHQTLLVLDANTGQNAISQARLFREVTRVTDIVLTKLDGTAKGGVIIGLADELGIPVRYVGVGETIDDLRDFDAREFVDALFQAG